MPQSGDTGREFGVFHRRFPVQRIHSCACMGIDIKNRRFLLACVHQRLHQYNVFQNIGMIAGMGVMLGWYAAGLSRYMYEILPGFAAGLATILFLNHTLPQRDPKVLREFDSMTAELRSGTR